MATRAWSFVRSSRKRCSCFARIARSFSMRPALRHRRWTSPATTRRLISTRDFFCPGVRGKGQAAIDDDGGATATAGARFQRRQHVGHGRAIKAMAVKDLVRFRKAVAVQDQADDDLLTVGPVIARVPAPGLRVVRALALEVGGRQVVEVDRVVEVEQRVLARGQRLFDRRAVRMQPIELAGEARGYSSLLSARRTRPGSKPALRVAIVSGVNVQATGKSTISPRLRRTSSVNTTASTVAIHRADRRSPIAHRRNRGRDGEKSVEESHHPETRSREFAD